MKDVIVHETVSVFGFKDRIKILFGKPLTITSRIVTDHNEVRLTGEVEVKTWIPSIWPRFGKRKDK